VKQTLDALISRYFRSTNYLVVLCLLLIVLLGFGARLWRLDSAPKGALIDELHFGYLAHSLIETGKDEHGESWPIIFRAFGDEKLPAMAYLDIPSVAIFGLSLTAIRIPSVLAGTLLILVSFWLLRELKFSRSLSLLGALITAVSPWSFFLSRFGFESNIAVLCFTVGLAALFRALNTPSRWWYALAGVSFGLSWYSYIAYRPITAVLLIALYAFLFWQKKFTKLSLVAAIAMLIVIAPLFQPKVLGVNSTRFEQVGVSSGSALDAVVQENRNFCLNTFPSFLCKVVFNKPLLSLKVISNNYLLSFSPEFLVGNGE
jgi:4-amino-4-deoxy-L-arabinose transferase-like glycosyltransferase